MDLDEIATGQNDTHLGHSYLRLHPLWGLVGDGRRQNRAVLYGKGLNFTAIQTGLVL